MLNKPYFHDLRNYLVTDIISGKEESGAFFGYMSRKRLRNLICKKTSKECTKTAKMLKRLYQHRGVFYF